MAFTFTPQEQDTGSKIATIVKRMGSTSYSVKDTKGRQYTVDATEVFTPGQTVAIKNGIILGRTRSTDTYKEYVV